MKSDFLKYIGAENSLAGYSRSYKLVFYKAFFSLMDDSGIASGYKVADAFRNFYVDRVHRGLKADVNADAQYTLGKLYLLGQDIPQDREQSLYWFTQSAEQGNEYAQFFLDRWDTMGLPSVMLSVTRLLHRLAQTFRETPLPHDSTTMQLRTDHKLCNAQQEKRIAMGHKEDDHEEHTQTWGGMTMGM